MKKNYLSILALMMFVFILLPSLTMADINDSAKIISANDGFPGDMFGQSVSISGNQAVVGACNNSLNNNSNSAYVFEKINNEWKEVAKLTVAESSDSSFGFSVSISGNQLIIGARGNSYQSGSAYIFEKINGTWVEVAKLKASDSANFNNFGWSVSISDNQAIVGAPSKGTKTCSAYAFEKINGTWVEVAKLNASDSIILNNFGWSVSISGNQAIVGDYQNIAHLGSAYVFEKINGNWTEVTKLTASDGTVYSSFGYSVSIFDDSIIIGAATDDMCLGSVYLYKRINGNWIETDKITASNNTGGFLGISVSISENTAVAGACGSADNIAYTGAYVFRYVNGIWAETADINVSNNSDDHFGCSVSISGNQTIVGAFGGLINLSMGTANIYQTDMVAPNTPLLFSPSNNGANINPSNVNFQWYASTDYNNSQIEYCITVKEDGSPEDIPIFTGCDENYFIPEVWNGQVISTSGGSCGNASVRAEISNNLLTGLITDTFGRTYDISGSVNDDGLISAGISVSGYNAGTFAGIITSDSGNGTWQDYFGCSGVWNIDKSIQSFVLPRNLQSGKKYWWAVWAKDEKGNWSEASEWWNFTTNSNIVIPNQPVIETSGLPKGIPNVPYLDKNKNQIGISVTNGIYPYTWKIAKGELPTGLSLDPDTGNIYGLPTVSGDFGFAVCVTDSNGGIDTKELHINVREPLLPVINSGARRFALIIGPQYDGFTADTRSSAKAFYEELKYKKIKEWKFDYVDGLDGNNLSWDDIKTKLDMLLSFMKEGDHFLLYISGHGGTDNSFYLTPDGNIPGDEGGLLSQKYFSYESVFIDKVRGISFPATTLTMNTSDDEYILLSANGEYNLNTDPYYLNYRIYDDDLTDYFLTNPMWNKINKHLFFDFCFSGGFWGGNDKGDLDKLDKITFVAATPEGFLSTSGRLWNYIRDAMNQENFNYTFEALNNYLNEKVVPRVHLQEYVATAGPALMNNCVFDFLEYPVVFNDNLIEDVIPFVLGDLNNDGCIDQRDYTIIATEVRKTGYRNPRYDLNNDGLVNIVDARFLVTRFTNPRGASCQ